MPGLIIDLDGTLFAGTEPLPHVQAFMAEVRSRQWPFLFVTNNSSASPEAVAAKLTRITGIEAHASEVLTSAMAAARYIREQGAGRRVLWIGEDGLRQALEAEGLEAIDPEVLLSGGADSAAVPIPDYVVQGIDRAFHYGKLELAVRLIRAGARYIQTNPDHLLPTEHGLIPGAGSIAAAIRISAEQEPTLIGKPAPVLFQYAMERLGLSSSEIWAIGDNIRTDIGGGIAVGCRTALMLTGLAAPSNVDSLIRESGIQPDVVCRHLLELLEVLLHAGAASE